MDNSWDVPNAQFADLKPISNPTSVKEAIAIRAIDGQTHSFRGCLHRDWCTLNALVAQGGLTVTHFQATAREYFRLQYPKLSQPDSLHLQVQFLAPVPYGELIFHVKDLKIGRKLSVVQIELQTKGQDGKLATRTTAIVTQGNLATEKGPTGKSSYNFKAYLPRREDCVRWNEKWWMELVPITRQIRTWLPLGGPDARWQDRFGPGIREGWIKMDDGSGFNSVFLGQLCDPWLAVPTSFLPDAEAAQKALLAYGTPTVSMSLEVKRDPNSAEWLFTRVEMSRVERGRLTLDVTVFNEDGEIVAIARLMSLSIEIPERQRVAEKL